MAVSEAQKRASNKYIATHMSTLACKVRKQEAEKFKEYAIKHNTTVNTLIKNYVMQCLEDDETMERDNNKPTE